MISQYELVANTSNLYKIYFDLILRNNQKILNVGPIKFF